MGHIEKRRQERLEQFKRVRKNPLTVEHGSFVQYVCHTCAIKALENVLNEEELVVYKSAGYCACTTHQGVCDRCGDEKPLMHVRHYYSPLFLDTEQGE